MKALAKEPAGHFRATTLQKPQNNKEEQGPCRPTNLFAELFQMQSLGISIWPWASAVSAQWNLIFATPWNLTSSGARVLSSHLSQGQLGGSTHCLGTSLLHVQKEQDLRSSCLFPSAVPLSALFFFLGQETVEVWVTHQQPVQVVGKEGNGHPWGRGQEKKAETHPLDSAPPPLPDSVVLLRWETVSMQDAMFPSSQKLSREPRLRGASCHEQKGEFILAFDPMFQFLVWGCYFGELFGFLRTPPGFWCWQ